MALGPIDYGSTTPNPLQSVLQGFSLGQGFQDQVRQNQALEQQKAAQQQYQADLQAAISNPSPQNFLSLTLKYPQHREAYKQGWEQLNATQQQSELRDGASLLASLQSGRSDVATSLLDNRIKAMETAGQDTTVYKSLRDQVQSDPKKAYAATLTVVSGLPGGDKILEGLGKIGTEARAQEMQAPTVAKAVADAATAQSGATIKAEEAKVAPTIQQQAVQKGWEEIRQTKANIANLNSQIGTRAAQLRLDQDKLALETQKFLAERQDKATDIGQDGRKIVNDSAVTAGAAKLAAGRANDLADRISQIGTSWGKFGSVAEWLKSATGSQGAISELRQEYTRLRNSGLKEYLPPGPSTDKDVALALEGFPSSTADPAVMASFLRGVAKMNDINAAVENAKADFVSNNRGLLGRSKTSFSAGGTDVKAGDDWTTISKRVAEEAARKYAPKDAVPLSEQDGYVENGVPGRPVVPRNQPAAKPTGQGVVVSWDQIRDN